MDDPLGADVPPPAPAEAIPRRVYITKAILDKHGLTSGCLGCTNATLGLTSTNHTEACRRIIEDAMKQDKADS